MPEQGVGDRAHGEETREQPKYVIDPQWYEERGVDLAQLVSLRRCGDCAGVEFPLKGAALRRSRTKAGAAASTASASWEAEMRAIHACCSTKTGYVTAETGLMEAVFRLLLQNANQPMSVDQLHDRIRESWAGLEYLRSTSVTALVRILERQSSYGIRTATDAELRRRAS